MNEFNKAVGLRLEEIRKRRKITREEASEKLGATYARIQGHESGRNGVNGEQLVDYCRTYRAAAWYILTGEGPMDLEGSLQGGPAAPDHWQDWPDEAREQMGALISRLDRIEPNLIGSILSLAINAVDVTDAQRSILAEKLRLK